MSAVTILGLVIGVVIGCLSGVNQHFLEMYLLGWAGSYVLITVGGYL